MSDADLLFSPYRLKTIELPNRVVMAPMTRSFSPGHVPTVEVAAYYRRRAEHGVGLIITEATGIDRAAAVNEPDVPRFHGGEALSGWKRVVDEVHAAGGRIMPQLWHVGRKLSRASGSWQPDSAYESPSGLSLQGEPVGHAMTEADIRATIDAFAQAASDARHLGFDGVEVHGGHGYLVNQFLFDHLNLRTDGYGGKTLLERSRFAIEVVEAIRRRVGDDFPILFRFSQWKPTDFHARLIETPNLLEEWATALIAAGVDAFDCSQQHYWDVAFPEADPDLNLAGWVKKLTGITSITVGSVGLESDVYSSMKGQSARAASIAPLLSRLRRQEFDLVMVGRPLLQDPTWLEKVRRGEREHAGFDPRAFDTLS